MGKKSDIYHKLEGDLFLNRAGVGVEGSCEAQFQRTSSF